MTDVNKLFRLKIVKVSQKDIYKKCFIPKLSYEVEKKPHNIVRLSYICGQ